MFKVTCLVDPQRTVGTPRKFDLESPQTTDMCYMNAQKERGSDSENFGTRITRFLVVVEKI
jgi:hypothetical protein